MAYTLEQVRAAYKNAAAAGDQKAADTLLRHAQQIAIQNAPQETYDPTEGMGTGAKLVAGYSRGVRNVGRQIGNLAGLISDEQMEEAKRLDAPLMNTGAGMAGSMIGETIVTAPLMAGGAGVATRAGGMAARAAANPIARGVAEGAAQGALMAGPGERGSGALFGGVLGGAIPGAVGAGSKVMRGVSRTPEAQMLLDRGVDLTPGQMNPSGLLNQMEESWQSVPGVGSVIKGARDNAQNSFQRVAAEAASAPGTRVAQGDAADMLNAAYKSFEPLYDQAKGFPAYPGILRTAGGDVPLASFGKTPGAFQRAAMDRGVRADDATRKTVANWLDNQLTQLPGKGRGQVSSDALMDLRSSIRTEARAAASQGDEASAKLLENAEKAVTQSLESQLPPDALQALRTADSRYGVYKTLEDAVARSKDMPGGFTPTKLSEAVAGANRGLGKGSYARGGGGDLRDLAQAGTTTMNVRSPPTGQRLAAIGLPMAAGAAAPQVAIPAGAGLLGLVGTQTGRKLAAGATPAQRRAQALVEAMRAQAPELAWQGGNEYLQRLLVAQGTQK